MNNVMGVIFASDNEAKLTDLTIHRTTASLPFCGRYRLIDFTLSNFVNSGITKIALVTRSNYSSLMDHIMSIILRPSCRREATRSPWCPARAVP